MIALMDDPAMAVRTPYDNTMIILTNHPLLFNLNFSSLEKTGYSDSESIGGSLESLSSPGEHMPAFVSVTFLSLAYEDLVKDV